MTAHRRFLQALFVTAMILPPLNHARAATVENLRIGVHGDTVRMVLDLDAALPYRAFIMQSPDRLAVDLPSFDWHVGKIARPAGSGVANVRQGALTAGVSRVVVDLDRPAAIKSAFVIKGQNGGSRLVIDFARAAEPGTQVFGTLKEEAPAAASAPPPQAQPSAPSVPAQPIFRPHARADDDDREPPVRAAARKPPRDNAPPPVIAGEKPLIVIDPGHGGVDPGSLGVNGLFEKNVTIGMARALKAQLEATGRYRVLMTRDGDTYLRLSERVAFARTHHASLFVSLHADSISRSGVTGASIYTLSDKASDEQTAKLAARENRADMIGGLNMDGQDDQVANILVDLVMRDNMNQSKFFANSVVEKMRGDGINLLENTQRSAGFAVLKAPDIPSVLIELGFMTNARESAMLMSPAYRQKVADALVSGIDSYFRTIGKANRT